MAMAERQSLLRRWLPMPVAFGFFGLFYIALFTGDPTRLPSALIGQKVPDFTLPGLETGSAGLRSGDLATGKPIVLNVWASWCGPCREEHPHLMALARAGVTVFGLNYKDDADAARALSARLATLSRSGLTRAGGWRLISAFTVCRKHL